MNKIKGGWWVTASCLHNQLKMYIYNLVGGLLKGTGSDSYLLPSREKQLNACVFPAIQLGLRSL